VTSRPAPGSVIPPHRETGVSIRSRKGPELGGLVVAARLNSSTPKAGTGFELDVIASCFIGGASAYGGVGGVIGAVIGAFVMGVLNNGMSIQGVSIDWQQAVKGLVLLAAVFFDVRGRSREG